MEELNEIIGSMNESIKMLESMRAAGKLLDESELAVSYTMRGLLQFQFNLFDESIKDLDKGIEIVEKMHDENKQFDENVSAKAYSCRGMAYFFLGELNQAVPDLRKGIDIWEHLQNSGRPVDEGMLFNLYIIRGGMLNATNEYMDIAISDYRKSIKIAESLKSAGEPFDEEGLALAYMGIGQSCDQKKEYSEANNYYSRSIEIWEQMQKGGQELSNDAVNSLPTAYMNRGSNFYMLNENDKAMVDYNKCINMRERLRKEGVEQDEFDIAMSYTNRSNAYHVDKNIKAAVNDNITALNIIKDVFSERPELQEFYYDTLDGTIGLLAHGDDKTLYNSVIQEFLHSMRSVPKEEEAEEAQNNILKKLE
jgi:tetratricopeptide (TPR) repeat protein